jgi:hypothetical protein
MLRSLASIKTWFEFLLKNFHHVWQVPGGSFNYAKRKFKNEKVGISKIKMPAPLHSVMQPPNTLKRLDKLFQFKYKMLEMNGVNMMCPSSAEDDGCE